MIKATIENMVILGLSDENIQRLTHDQPIKFNLKELGMGDINILIFHGKTEQEMKQTMMEAGLIHPTKTIMKDSNADKN